MYMYVVFFPMAHDLQAQLGLHSQVATLSSCLFNRKVTALLHPPHITDSTQIHVHAALYMMGSLYTCIYMYMYV